MQGTTNHAGFRDRADDFTIELLVAVLRGDLAKAREVIDLRFASAPDEGRLILEAKKRAGLLPSTGARAPRPMVLPVPGHAPGSTLANPVLDGR